MKLIPLGDRVVVKQLEAIETTKSGIVLTGGGSLLNGLEDIIEQRTGIQTMTAENPACCVAVGTGLYAEVMAAFA